MVCWVFQEQSNEYIPFLPAIFNFFTSGAWCCALGMLYRSLFVWIRICYAIYIGDVFILGMLPFVKVSSHKSEYQIFISCSTKRLGHHPRHRMSYYPSWPPTSSIIIWTWSIIIFICVATSAPFSLINITIQIQLGVYAAYRNSNSTRYRQMVIFYDPFLFYQALTWPTSITIVDQ